jgi:hypothetical protein
MCGPVSAYAAAPVEKWCSDGFDGRAQITTTDHGYLLQITGRPDKNLEDEDDALTSANLRVLVEGSQGDEQHVWIYQDRYSAPALSVHPYQ